MMEISNEVLVDVALNAVGFVLGGALTAVIYSMFGRKGKLAPSTDFISAANGNNVLAASNERAGARIEFIDFQSKGKSAVKATATNVNPISENKQFQKNRLEVIKQAREILNGGNMTGHIRRNLSLTDSDFQLSDQRRKVLAKRGAANDQ